MDPKQTILAFVDAINSQDWARLDSLVATDFVRHGFRGTQHGALGSYLPTGKTMNGVYIAIYHVRNGQILESWAEWDNLAGLRQLGHL